MTEQALIGTSAADGDWFQNDALFAELLRTGHVWAERVGRELRGHGLVVSVTPMAWRRSIDRRGDFADEIDLTVGRERRRTLDVKSRNIAFTSPADYPYETALVDTVSGWQAKPRKPAAIVLVSQITSAMLVIPTSTEPGWTTRRRHDRVRGMDDRFLEIPRGMLVQLSPLVDWLKTHTDGSATAPGQGLEARPSGTGE